LGIRAPLLRAMARWKRSAASLRNLVSRKPLQRRRHVLDRGRTILRTDGPVCMAGDVVRHSLAYPDPVGDLLERVTPSAVWLQLPEQLQAF
jgi:hypothetical protein